MAKIVKPTPKKPYFTGIDLAKNPDITVHQCLVCRGIVNLTENHYHVYLAGNLVQYGTLGQCLRWVAARLGDPAGVATVKEARDAGFEFKAFWKPKK